MQLHHRSRDREAPAHVSHLPPVLSLSVVVILKDLTSFVNPMERCRRGFFFFFCQYMLVL